VDAYVKILAGPTLYGLVEPRLERRFFSDRFALDRDLPDMEDGWVFGRKRLDNRIDLKIAAVGEPIKLIYPSTRKAFSP
jgi:hypothetical protein